VLAAVAVSSASLHLEIESLGCVSVDVSAESSVVSGKRSAEQRDRYFTGRVAEMRRICDAIEAVLANARPASTATNIAVLGLPGMGKSLLVSQALLEMQKTARGQAARSVLFEAEGPRLQPVWKKMFSLPHAAWAARLPVAADTPPSDALRLFKDYLSRLRFVAIIDDADVDGLQAAARLIPVSSALHAVLVTSQQKEEELAPIEGTLGRFEKITLCGFEESTSVELMRKRCPAICSQEQRLKMSPGAWTIFRWECDCFASGARLDIAAT